MKRCERGGKQAAAAENKDEKKTSKTGVKVYLRWENCSALRPPPLFIL